MTFSPDAQHCPATFHLSPDCFCRTPQGRMHWCQQGELLFFSYQRVRLGRKHPLQCLSTSQAACMLQQGLVSLWTAWSPELCKALQQFCFASSS